MFPFLVSSFGWLLGVGSGRGFVDLFLVRGEAVSFVLLLVCKPFNYLDSTSLPSVDACYNGLAMNLIFVARSDRQ